MEVLLSELERLLYGYDYCVFLRAYRIPFVPGKPAEWYVSQALGSAAVIGGLGQVTGPEIAAEVERSLRYAGDGSSGPKPSVLQSHRFEELVAGVLDELARAVAGAELLAGFWLRDGHPAYPVFWDFGFVIAGPGGGLVLIGSSSD
jgi:hypothetical protein